MIERWISVYTSIKRLIGIITASSLLIITGFLLGTLGAPMRISQAADQLNGSVNAQSDVGTLLAETERIYSEIYNRVAPSVVSIVVSARADDQSQFFNSSTGSGFVIDTSGHIVTNFHVIEGADRIEIKMFDGTITRASIVGTDPDADLAVIRVSLAPDRLTPVALGDSDALQVGQTVLAIGNPFQNDWTLTTGIVSALNRTIIGMNNYSIGGVIQTDAAINPGNSGGPLLNLRGEVVGVNSQIDSTMRQNSGIGFAVPSNLVQRVSQELITNGQMRYSYIGINSRPIDLDLIEEFRLPDNIQGVAVWQVIPQGPASAGGLQTISANSVDIITAIDSTPLHSFDELVAYLAVNTAPGQTVSLTVYRGGQLFSTPVTLIERPR